VAIDHPQVSGGTFSLQDLLQNLKQAWDNGEHRGARLGDTPNSLDLVAHHGTRQSSR